MNITPISRAQIKNVTSLRIKKYRDGQNAFVAEGRKCISELLAGFEPQMLVVRDGAQPAVAEDARHYDLFPTVVRATEQQMKQISTLVTPTDCLAVFRQAEDNDIDSHIPDYVLALDGVQDPGNLGTIIRTCDWMGIGTVLCSEQTADCYSPKVVQSTMGALSRVRLVYTGLDAALTRLKEHGYQVFGTVMDGENIYASDAVCDAERAVIVMGNEGNGISADILRLVTHRLTIPAFTGSHVESLNVSIATALVLSEFQRNRLKFSNS
ncbi:MAG: RNA methyltransferase [Paludibacteraceae bacterium]|nr:RNA methyltransferase [Paludibacteraceae bacterium]